MKWTIYARGKVVEGHLPLDAWDEEGVSVFETLRVYRGTVFCEAEHLQRLQESARTLGSGLPCPVSQIQRELKQAVAVYGQPEAIVRIAFVGSRLLIWMGQRSVSPELYEKGVALQTSPVRRSPTHAGAPEIKSSAYQNPVLTGLAPSAPGIFEWLALDWQGHPAEVRTGNLFIIPKKGRKKFSEVWTPPCPGILNGVTRRFVIECAHTSGIHVREEIFSRHEIFNAAESFLTNTSWEILPVRQLDGRAIGQAIPGPVTQQLQREFRKRVLAACQPRSKGRSSASRTKPD